LLIPRVQTDENRWPWCVGVANRGVQATCVIARRREFGFQFTGFWVLNREVLLLIGHGQKQGEQGLSGE
jgi:hypothetical protein